VEDIPRNTVEIESDNAIEEIFEIPRHLIEKKSKKRKRQTRRKEVGESSIHQRMTRTRTKQLEKNKQ
jgi:hypothetical protein